MTKSTNRITTYVTFTFATFYYGITLPYLLKLLLLSLLGPPFVELDSYFSLHLFMFFVTGDILCEVTWKSQIGWREAWESKSCCYIYPWQCSPNNWHESGHISFNICIWLSWFLQICAVFSLLVPAYFISHSVCMMT